MKVAFIIGGRPSPHQHSRPFENCDVCRGAVAAEKQTRVRRNDDTKITVTTAEIDFIRRIPTSSG
jgi:hypothetical protein